MLAAHDKVIEEDRFLRDEVTEHRAACDAGGVRDLIDRSVRVSLFDEQLPRRNWTRGYKNHATFVFAWLKSAVSAQRKGFLVRADAMELVSAALRSDIGR